MDRSNEVRRIADRVIGVPTRAEETLVPNEYYLHTGCWKITEQQFDELRKEMQVTEILVDGFYITLTVIYK